MDFNLSDEQRMIVETTRNFVVNIDSTALAGVAEFVDFGLQLGNRLFKIEIIRVHAQIPES